VRWRCGDKDARERLIIFPKAGRYTLRLFVEGHELAERAIISKAADPDARQNWEMQGVTLMLLRHITAMRFTVAVFKTSSLRFTRSFTPLALA
jgi:hypothetical protein